MGLLLLNNASFCSEKKQTTRIVSQTTQIHSNGTSTTTVITEDERGQRHTIVTSGRGSNVQQIQSGKNISGCTQTISFSNSSSSQNNQTTTQSSIQSSICSRMLAWFK